MKIFELLPVAVVKLNFHLYIIVGLCVFAFLLLLISKAMKIIIVSLRLPWSPESANQI